MRPHTILLAFLVMAVSCFGQFYFANDGDNTDAGTIEFPWATLAKLNTSQAVAAECHEGTVYYFKRGDVFDDVMVTMDVGAGSAAAPIVIRDYGDPALDPPMFREVATGALHVFSFAGSDYVTLMNLEIVGNNDGADGARGVNIAAGSDNIEIHNCIIRDCLLAAGDYAVVLAGDNAVVANCEIYRAGIAGILVNGAASAVIRDCHIHDIGLEYMGLSDWPSDVTKGIGVYGLGTSSLSLVRSVINRCTFAGYHPNGTVTATLDACLITDSTSAVRSGNAGATTTMTNCVFEAPVNPDGSTARGIYSLGGTIVAKHCTLFGVGGACVYLEAAAGISATVQNCVFSSTDSAHWSIAAAEPSTYALWDVNNNAYWPDGATKFDGGDYAAWLLRDGQDEAGSVNTAASLVGGTIYPEAGRLLAAAPAIGAGAELVVATDFWGYARSTTEGDPVDIGAMSSLGGPYIPYPTGVVLVGREGPDGWTPDDLTDIPLSTATVVGGPNHWTVTDGTLGSLGAWATYTITAGPYASGRPLWSCETAREGGQITIPALTGPVGQDLYLTISVDHGATIDKEVPVAGRIKVAVK